MIGRIALLLGPLLLGSCTFPSPDMAPDGGETCAAPAKCQDEATKCHNQAAQELDTCKKKMGGCEGAECDACEATYDADVQQCGSNCTSCSAAEGCPAEELCRMITGSS